MTNRYLITKTHFKTVAMLIAISLSGQGLVDAQTHDPERQSDSVRQSQRRPQKSTDAQSQFLQLTRDAAGTPKSLQTSITRYQSADGKVLVDLVGAVHIGEQKYYRQLNKQLSQYDVVLYELVAPKGTRIPAGGKRDQGGATNPLAWMQGSMKNMLGLESQLELIDYQAKNFVHADLSPTELSEKMAERGDNMFTLGLSAFSEMMSSQKRMKSNLSSADSQQMDFGSMMDLLNNPLELKRMLASQFTASGSMDMGLGKKLNQLIVTDRNKAAMKELKSQLNRNQKRIAIFYGAAHMPDFENRLVKDLDLKKSHHVWVDAWDLQSAPRKQSNEFSELGSLFMKLMDSIDQ